RGSATALPAERAPALRRAVRPGHLAATRPAALCVAVRLLGALALQSLAELALQVVPGLGRGGLVVRRGGPLGRALRCRRSGFPARGPPARFGLSHRRPPALTATPGDSLPHPPGPAAPGRPAAARGQPHSGCVWLAPWADGPRPEPVVRRPAGRHAHRRRADHADQRGLPGGPVRSRGPGPGD